MLLKDHGASSKSAKGERYENMHVAIFPEMCLFTTTITFPDVDNEGEIEVSQSIISSRWPAQANSS